ncbi:MAG: VanZ family protein [Candidatus Nanopelagicales bacterium]|nr:VanZ family protein [Candidatus Nanopelagicales bacterium]MCF8538790.1 VanZ family protein [Candidatus Nanopelagicales bacterium]MCF8550728.1 VanZ family protein [Candidatus Nanopelagicales bacterium]
MRSGTVARVVARVAFALVLTVTVWGSLVPTESLPGASVSDTVLHLGGYLVLGALAIASGFSRLNGFLFVVGVGLTLEIAQGILGYRSFEVKDLVVNAVGAAIGVAAASLILTRYRYRRQ